MKVKCTSDNRNLILQILQQETGEAPIYHGLPDFSYTVGGYRLLRSGYIEFDAGCDADLIDSLASLGLCETPGHHAPASEHNPKIAGYPPSYPVTDHTGRTLLNLFSIISARQSLLNRALDAKGAFFVEHVLMEELLAHPPASIPEFRQTLYRREKEYHGLTITDGAIILDGFRKGRPDEVEVHCQLADLIMQAALKRRWTKPFTRNVRNKKYYFRMWLNSIGMIGPEYEQARLTLLYRLPGRADQRMLPWSTPAGGARIAAASAAQDMPVFAGRKVSPTEAKSMGREA